MTNTSRSCNLVAKACAWLLLLVGTLALGYLLKLRFDAGDAMPRGSTLRSDPLGMEVLFESLNSSGIVVAERNYQSLKHCDLSSFDMVFISHGKLPMFGPGADALRSFVTNRGGRLLITLPPQSQHVERNLQRERRERSRKPAKKPDAAEDSAGNDQTDNEGDEAAEADKNSAESPVAKGPDATGSFSNRLWLAVEHCALQGSPESAALNPDYPAGDFELPPLLSVKTCQGFSTNILAQGWSAVYHCDGVPVIAERDFGPGRVIVSSLSFPFSNEAMRGQRETGFLLWAFQGSSRVLFDESHFGLVISRTVAKLIRKNNLHYALLALVLPVALYFWLAAVPLLPRYGRDAVALNERSAGSGNGLCNLLMRSIPPREIVAAALESWRRNNSGCAQSLPDDLVDQLLARNCRRARRLPREHEIVAAYNEAVELLKEKQ
ncbi:MAG: hypothetical protein PHO37_13760 [Kiritimatiellae bacterium]|nr:hypothetical protein [Kiritimatiellia bacterium]